METQGRVQGKVAVVTGGGSGIGRATAILLAREGATSIVADSNNRSAKAVVVEITNAGGRATAVELDVSDRSAWRQAIDEILAGHKQIDVLVNNAGISVSMPISELTLEDWRKVMAVNLDGLFLGTKHAIEAMTRRGGGSIINVSSVSGIKPSAGASAYCASKAAVRVFSKAVAIECADAGNGIRVNVVTPGGVKTPMWEEEEFFQDLMAEHGGAEAAFVVMAGDAPSHQFFTPEEVAQTILYLASDESSHLAGTEIVMDRGHSG